MKLAPQARRVLLGDQSSHQRATSSLSLSDTWATPGPLRGVAGVVHVVRDRPTPKGAVLATAARRLLRYGWSIPSTSTGRRSTSSEPAAGLSWNQASASNPGSP